MLSETTHHTIFLLERLTLLPDIWCPTELLPVQAPMMPHHPHTVFSHELLHIFSSSHPPSYGTGSSTACSPSHRPPNPSLPEEYLQHSGNNYTTNWWCSQWLFYPGDTHRCKQVCLYPPAVLPPIWSLIPLSRTHNGMVFLHSMQGFLQGCAQSFHYPNNAISNGPWGCCALPASWTSLLHSCSGNSSFTTLRTA